MHGIKYKRHDSAMCHLTGLMGTREDMIWKAKRANRIFPDAHHEVVVLTDEDVDEILGIEDAVMREKLNLGLWT